jgi:hypothetical protein
MVSIGCSETSEHNYLSTLPNIPEKCRCHLQRGRSLKRKTSFQQKSVKSTRSNGVSDAGCEKVDFDKQNRSLYEVISHFKPIIVLCHLIRILYAVCDLRRNSETYCFAETVNIWKGEVILWRPKVAKKASPFVFA